MEKHKIEWKDFQSLIKLYEPRWYQKDVLQNKSIKKIIRGGRRVGKTEIMCLTALYKAITNPSFKIMFAAPYKSQVKIFFEKIKSIINNSSLSSPTLRTTSTNVIEMKFNNDSLIIGRTKDEVHFCEQEADMILIDDCDYFTDAEIDTILAIAHECDNVEVLLASTPTGEKNRFWQICTAPNTSYQEFHFPSIINPGWNLGAENGFKMQMSEDQYRHEIMAEFD